MAAQTRKGRFETMATPVVFFDITIGGAPFVFELFAHVVPKTAEKLPRSVHGLKGDGDAAKSPSISRGPAFTASFPCFHCQGGDFSRGN